LPELLQNEQQSYIHPTPSKEIKGSFNFIFSDENISIKQLIKQPETQFG